MTKEELQKRITDIEWDDFEVKEALNKLPDNVWETVSAFSNTSGGWIVFGVKHKGKRFEAQGIENGEKTESDFLNTLRNGQKFNTKIYPTAKKYELDGKLILAFFIESSQTKPIYFGNPINTFVRSGSGDRRASETEINAMFRDQAFGIRSELPAEGTSFNDLNIRSYESYRQQIRNFNSDFAFKNSPDEEFCKLTRITKNGMLTYASLLMFGKRESILEHFDNFWVDYIEIPGDSIAEASVRYTYRMQELENLWEYYEALIQRLRLHVDAPFMAGPNGFSPDDNSQLYTLREGLVNMLAHADFFSPMHCTIRVYDNRFEFQNPGRFMRDLKTLREIISSKPRNPSIIKFFRYAKLGENAGYGISKMIGWEQLTGKRVVFESDLDSSTVTYFRPKLGGSYGDSTTPVTTPVRNDISEKILQVVRSTPNITRAEIAKIFAMTVDGVKYHINKLKKAGRLEWEGNSRTGKWVVKY